MSCGAAAAAVGLVVGYKQLFDTGDMARMVNMSRKDLLPREEVLLNIQAAEMVRGLRSVAAVSWVERCMSSDGG
jgi:hypothetical protein